MAASAVLARVVVPQALTATFLRHHKRAGMCERCRSRRVETLATKTRRRPRKRSGGSKALQRSLRLRQEAPLARLLAFLYSSTSCVQEMRSEESMQIEAPDAARAIGARQLLTPGARARRRAPKCSTLHIH